MRNRLLVLGRFAHDPQSILATVGQFALMGIERGFNFLLRFGLELRVAAFAYSDYRRVLFYDPQFARRHDCSLAHPAGRRNACGKQTAPLPRRHHSRTRLPIGVTLGERQIKAKWRLA